MSLNCHSGLAGGDANGANAYLFAARYDRSPSTISAAIAVSTIIAAVTVSLLLAVLISPTVR